MTGAGGARHVVHVAVAAPLPTTLTYLWLADLGDAPPPGCQVLCPLGTRTVTGVVVSVASEVVSAERDLVVPEAEDAALPPRRQGPGAAEHGVLAARTGPRGSIGGGRLRPLAGLVDVAPVIDPGLLQVLLRAAAYYRAPPGELVRAALPPGAPLAAARVATLTGAGRAALEARRGDSLLGEPDRGDADGQLLARLAAADTALADLAPKDRSRLWRLAGEGLVEVRDLPPQARVRARVERRAALTAAAPAADAAELRRTPARARLLAALRDGPLPTPVLTERLGPGATALLRALVEAGHARIDEREVDRDPHAADAPPRDAAPEAAPPPTPAQAAALEMLGAALAAGEPRAVLLHGVTGAGKTEVYLRTIALARAQQRPALVLVPEIALTPQLVAVFRRRFGDQVAALHSGMSDGERFDEWRRLRDGRAAIAVGARSAVFAPLRNLGVVVIDEEHDASFKQEEGVRYDARDIALARARADHAVAILGSATPRLETWQEAASGRLALVELPERATPRPLPDVEVVDLRRPEERPARGSWLGPRLRAALAEAIGGGGGGQAILFINRRGYASIALCRSCGTALGCPRCDVTLTFHRDIERLLCHYCGEAQRLPDRCPTCTSGRPELLGMGTERIAAEVEEAVPGARVVRLDRDAAARRGVAAILRRFRDGEVNVLVGTQMVTKGHDFPRVTLVGVVAADMSLRIPDFRAGERTFQLLLQVAGRAGRGTVPGRVVVQAFMPEHPAIACARTHDFHSFARAELEVRRARGYPPFGRLAMYRISAEREADARNAAEALARAAARVAAAHGITVLGPAPAPIARVRNRHRWQLLLRAPSRAALGDALTAVAAAQVPIPPRAQVNLDVDPQSML
ncbi:MAG TPA: primosomal protein N' [Myxococcota bacterium]|nr:primosomal protein N' [Myxococcota bacterium]